MYGGKGGDDEVASTTVGTCHLLWMCLSPPACQQTGRWRQAGGKWHQIFTQLDDMKEIRKDQGDPSGITQVGYRESLLRIILIFRKTHDGLSKVPLGIHRSSGEENTSVL